MKKLLLILVSLVLLTGVFSLAQAATLPTTDYDDGSCPSEEAKENNNGQHHWSYEPGEVATCTTAGYYYYICSYCGAKRTVDVPALGHEWAAGQVIKQPTCTEAGEVEYICNRCGESKTESIAATGHTWGSWTTISAGTCVTPGVQQRTCQTCGATETQDGDYGDHEYGDWVTTREANCQQGKLETRTCKYCGATETREGAATGDHVFGNWIIDEYATCERRELQRRHCSVCGFIEWRYVGYLGDHVWGDWEVVREATKEEPGLRRRVCKKNKDHIEEEEIEYVPGPEPAIEMTVQYASAAPYTPGQTFPVTLVVTNTGNVPLSYVGHGTYGPSGESDALQALPATLDVGETWSGTHMITIVTEDYREDRPGVFERSWDVTYDYEGVQVWDEVTLQDALSGDPNQGYTGLAIEVSKTSADKTLYFLNDMLEFDVTLRNRSSYALSGSHLIVSCLTESLGTDSIAYNTADQGLSSLEPGASVTFHVVHTVDARDIELGSQKITFTGVAYSLASESGYDPEGPVVAGRVQDGTLYSDDYALGFSAAEKPAFDAAHLTLTVAQITAGKEAYAENDTLAFEVTLKNDGNEALEGCQANFPYGGELHPHVYGTLTSMKQGKYTCYYTVTAADAAAGTLTLTWEAFGLKSGWRDVKDLKDSDPHVVWASPFTFTAKTTTAGGSSVIETEPEAVSVTKWEDSAPGNGSFYTEGESIRFMVSVENITDAPISDVVLYDSLFEAEAEGGKIGTWSEIAAHETKTVQCVYTVTELDTQVGSVTNIAHIEALNHNGSPIAAASNIVEVPAGQSEDAVKVVKVETSTPANGSTYGLNETIRYTITLENTGAVDVTDVIIADNQADTFMGEIASIEILHAGQTHSVDYEHTVTELDLTYGYVKNYAIVYYMTAGSTWYKVTESDPVTSPTGTVPAAPPTYTPAKASSCVRSILADGDNVSEYSLDLCGEHQSVYNLVNTALKVVSSEADTALVWQKARKLWGEELDQEYEQLYTLLSNEGKAAAITSRMNFLRYIDTLEAMLLKTGTAGEAEINQVITDILMNRVADLCYLNAHLGENRSDSLVTGHWAALGAVEAPKACIAESYLDSEGNIRTLEELDETHAAIKTAVKAMLSHAGTKDEILSVFQRSRRLWLADLDSVTNYRYKAADTEGRQIIAANRTAFDSYLASEAALLEAVYPYNPETAAELTARAAMTHVITLCSRWSLPVTAGSTGSAVSAADPSVTAVPQAPEATAVPAQQPEITAEPLELATLIPTLEPVQATTPEPAATPEPTPYVAPTLNPDGTEPSGSLVVRVESEDGGEYTVQIYLKNDTMTFNPMMQLSCGKYGTIKRAKGDYTLQLIPVNGSAIVSIDGEPVETDENGVYTATVTILSGEKQEIHVILGNGNR